MNYSRVYLDFIESRRGREPLGYSELHHITPRSVGGGDELDNLIRLSLGDHYFAHLLVAKIHGGKLWTALFLMAQRFDKPEALRGRRMYQAARQRHIEHERLKVGLKGADNGNHNPSIFEWVNVDSGEEVSATLHEMWGLYGSTRGGWTSCLTGAKRTFLGWTVKGRVVNRGLKGKRHRLQHIDGRKFEGTQKEFSDMAGVSAAAACRVCRSGITSKGGWRLVA